MTSILRALTFIIAMSEAFTSSIGLAAPSPSDTNGSASTADNSPCEKLVDASDTALSSETSSITKVNIADLFTRKLLPRFSKDPEVLGLSTHLVDGTLGPYIGKEFTAIMGAEENGQALVMDIIFLGVGSLETGQTKNNLGLGFAKLLTAILSAGQQIATRNSEIKILQLRSGFTVNETLAVMMLKYGFRVETDSIGETYILDIPIADFK